MNVVEAFKNCGGEFGTDAASAADNDAHQASDTADEKLLVNITASHTCQRDKILAHAHIKKADPKRFHEMKKELENDFIKGNPNCKTVAQDSHAFISNCKLSGSNSQKQHKKGEDHEGLAFAQQGNCKNDNDDNDDNNKNDDEALKCVMCCVCGKKSHVATRCSQRNTIKDETCNANAEQEEEEQEPPEDTKPKASGSSSASSKSKKRVRRLVSSSLNSAKVKAILMMMMIMMAWNILCSCNTRRQLKPRSVLKPHKTR